MIYNIKIQHNDEVTKVRQIANIMSMDIENGLLKRKSQVPSITQFSKCNKVARETVEKAYNILKQQGYLISVPGKGYFVAGVPNTSIRILMIMNKISSYKKEVYEAFKKKMGNAATVDIKVYDYNPKIFCEIIDDNIDRYHYYIVMPHFYTGTEEAPIIAAMSKISSKKLLVLDRDFVSDLGVGSVFQDFEEDIFDAFSENRTLFKNYDSIKVIFPDTSHHPVGIIKGVSKFCKMLEAKFSVIKDINEINPALGEIFITLTESDLAIVIKKIKACGFKQGEGVGVISFNETVLKELLEITVVTTDFAQMGEIAADMIISNTFSKTRNPFKFIKRQSI